MPHASTELTQIIRREIQAAGPLSFARFMDLALYHPAHGYYQQPLKQIGCQGDFFTSVSVGNLFGHLLAFQFATWLDPLLPEAGEVQVLEAGAHDARLALDILSWFEQQRPDLLDRLQYWILEPSVMRRRSQSELLAPFADRTRWFGTWDELPATGVQGAIVSNELLDAFPMFRLGWDASNHCWFEWRVADTGDQFVWTRGTPRDCPEVQSELQTRFWRTLSPKLLELLPDSFTVEICPAARAWWAQAARTLKKGKLLSLDYGLEQEDLLAPQRQHGTLRSYRRHHSTPDPLAEPGQQDLTAHVNFSVLIEAGEEAGLRTEWFGRQADFLTQIALQAAESHLPLGFSTPACRRQFQTLTHPEFLGRSFRVLIQSI